MTITQDGFSIHTFEMNMQIRYDEYQSIRNSLNNVNDNFPGSNYEIKEKGIYVSLKFSSYGIFLYLLKSKLLPAYFKIEINPNTLLGNTNPYRIFQTSIENVLIVKEQINRILNTIGTSFTFDDMSISRIDLCVNINMGSQDIIKSYMRLFKKCLIPAGYIRDIFKEKFKNYKEKNTNSLHAHNSNILLNIYNKPYQVNDQQLVSDSATIHENNLRVEIGLFRPEIRDIINTLVYEKDLNDNAVLLEFMGLYSKSLMNEYLPRFFSNDNYVTYSRAQELIRNKKYKHKIEKRMFHLLENASACKNMNVAMKNLNILYDLSDIQSQYLMSRFHELGISPITLKNSENHILTLPGLLSILEMSESN